MAKSKSVLSDESPRTEVLLRVSDLLRLPIGPVDLKAIATRATPGFTGLGKTDATTAMRHLGPRLADLQEQLYAEGHTVAGAACCSCCKAWTPLARERRSSMSSGS